MDESRKKEKIKACIAIGIILIAIIVTGIVSMKYYVEGEKNLPFYLSKITIVSTAEGVDNKEPETTAENKTNKSENKWDFSIFQNNDVYFSIGKNENTDELIESVSIENIKITKTPEVGNIQIYMPNSVEGRTFSYNDEYILPEDNLIYRGGSKSNTKTLEIGNQGGIAVIRFSNVGIGDYISNEDEEIKHDGSMLAKKGINVDNLKFEVNFDLAIKMKNKNYVTNITLNMPCGGNLIEEGTTSEEITEGFIFRRVKI